MNPKLGAFIFSLFAMAGLGAISPLFWSGPSPGEVTQLPFIGAAPEFTLTDSSNSEFASTALKDHVWVLNFFFTSCQGPCPKMTANMAFLEEKLKDESRANFVSLSIDPERDTPAALLEYAKSVGADLNRWHFLTGNIEKIIEIAEKGFKLATDSQEKIHSTKFILIDRRGMIRGYYDGNSRDEMKRLEKDVRRLLII